MLSFRNLLDSGGEQRRMAPVERPERFSYSFHGCYRGWFFHVRYRYRTKDTDERDVTFQSLREDG